MSYLLAFYGDDFTGSTDAMEALTLGGVPTVLLLEPLSAEEIKNRFPHAKAIGLAGTSRSMTPAQMDEALPAAFHYLASLDAPIIHYKVCSTFDSSPELGSIGRALELGLDIFDSKPVPMVVGAPILKRYLAFGHLFAKVDSETYRLDRHPTMSQHPLTPMHESDLRLHLGQQSSVKVKLFDLLALEAPGAKERYHSEFQDADAVLFDTLNDNHLRTIGQILRTPTSKPQFWLGSSGMEYALIAHLQASAEASPQVFTAVPAVKQVLIMSGSAAPATAAQIAWAETQGFASIRLDTCSLLNPEKNQITLEGYLEQATKLLKQGKSVLLYSAKGPDDPAIKATKGCLQRLGFDPKGVGKLLGKQQGRLLKCILEHHPLQRICVSGGDTCGHVTQHLGLTALELLVPIAPGSPLCKAQAKEAAFDGLEIALKAGQVGRRDYFGSILSGEVNHFTGPI